MYTQEMLKSDEIIPHVIGLFESAGIKQFESLDKSVEIVRTAGSDSDILKTYIDIGSTDIKVSLLLRVPRSVLIKTIPGVPVGSETDEMLEDWVMELANRLMGRLKNKLLSHNCVLQMGLPKSYASLDVEALFELDEGKKLDFFFDMQGEIIECYLSVNLLDSKMEMDLYEDEDEDWFDESELEDL